MNILNVTRKELDLQPFIKRSALRADCTRFIDTDTLVVMDGKPVILYQSIPESIDTTPLREAVKQVRFGKEKRTSGLVTESAIFGYNPRNVIRKDYCSATSMAYNQPEQHAQITAFGPFLTQLYQKHFPAVYERHCAVADEKVLPSWRIENTPFTSGIVNRNNPLKYHFDQGNFKDVLSNMVVFKKGSVGGHLACPEFDIVFDCADNTVMLFDGQKILHGVTPFRNIEPGAYRYSIVYYSLVQMWNCMPLDEEIARIRKIHTKRERNRANGKINSEDLQWDDN